MIGTRESVYSAIFDLLSSTPGFASYWRRIPPVEQLNTAQKPALLMRQKTEQVTAYFAMPSKYHILIEVCIVVQTPVGPIDAVPAIAINELIDAIELQLAPSTSDGRLTLGNVNIERVWIEGVVDIFEAITEDTSYAFVPIHVIAV